MTGTTKSQMEVEGFYRVIPLNSFRKTDKVDFESVPMDLLPRIDGIDRVIHGSAAFSPGKVGEIERPWYMHTHQVDHLLVMHGQRTVDLFSVERGEMVTFVVGPNYIKKNGEVVCDGAALLSWSRGVFHRVISGVEGSASINFAFRAEGIDMRTNFSIYGLDTDTGKFSVIREGHLDQ